ncbi:MAG: hypothetical protein AB8G16_09790 [Gammaproteobacteria bacterium]
MSSVSNQSFIDRLPEADRQAIAASTAKTESASQKQTPTEAVAQIQSNPVPQRNDIPNIAPADREAVYQQQVTAHYDSQSGLAAQALVDTEPQLEDFSALPPTIAQVEYHSALADFNHDPAVAELREIAEFDGAAYLQEAQATGEIAESDPVPTTPVEIAVADVEAKQDALDTLQELADSGDNVAQAELDSGNYQAELEAAEANLVTVVEGEIGARQYELRHLPVNVRTSYETAAGQVVGNFNGSEAGEQILRDVVDGLTTDYIERQDRLDSIQSTAEDIVGADSDEESLAAFTDALTAGEGDPDYQAALTATVLRQDPSAVGSWLNPAFINGQAESGAISGEEYTLAAQAFVGAANDGLFAEQDIGHAVEYFSEDGSPLNGTVLDSFLIGFHSRGIMGGTVDAFTPVQSFAELNQLVNAAGSNPETQQFREEFAQHLNDTYVQNPNILNRDVRNVAAAGAALIISGDSSSPELAQDFLTELYESDPAQFNEFMDRANSGSFYFSQEGLEIAQRLGHGLSFDAADFAQPDAVAQIVSAFGAAGPDPSDSTVADVALELARAPDNNSNWTDTVKEERRDAWAELFVNHSETILDSLTDPSGLPTVSGTNVTAGFVDRSEDLGALLRYIQVADNNTEVVGALTEYNEVVRDRIANADNADDAIDESRRLGFLGASITESVDQGFEEFEDNLAQQQALVGFVVDLAFSALPLGTLAKGATGSQIEAFIKDNLPAGFAQDFVTASLKGFTGSLISDVDGQLTGAAREFIIDQVGNEELGELVADLTESNTFIQDVLFADLPAPGYTPSNDQESGRADVILAVRTAYDIALASLTD